MPSMKDVAIYAGVSVATVSRVLADKPHVRPEIRAAVLSAVAALNYRPNRVASNLRKQSSAVIGLLVTDIRNPFFTAIARAIEDVAISRGMSVFLCNTDENPDKEHLYLNTLLEENVAGMILAPAQESLEPYDFLMESGTPVVTIDRRIEGARLDCVLSDNTQSAYELTKHLIERGYTRIAAVIGLKGSTTGRERMQGYRAALSEYSIPFNPNTAVYAPPRESEGEVIIRQFLDSRQRPDALLTGNSRLTLGALNAIRTAGLTFPHDLALAGFDETAWMSHVGAGVTVISQPTYEMGQTAAELLFQRMETPGRPTREVILKGTLIERGSTAPKS